MIDTTAPVQDSKNTYTHTYSTLRLSRNLLICPYLSGKVQIYREQLFAFVNTSQLSFLALLSVYK